MKKVIYALILPLIVVSGLLFANRETKNETSKKSIPKATLCCRNESRKRKHGRLPLMV